MHKNNYGNLCQFQFFKVDFPEYFLPNIYFSLIEVLFSFTLFLCALINFHIENRNCIFSILCLQCFGIFSGTFMNVRSIFQEDLLPPLKGLGIQWSA